MKKIELSNMELKIGKQKINLSIEEMKELKRVLLEAFPEPYPQYVPYIPYYPPFVEPTYPYYETDNSDDYKPLLQTNLWETIIPKETEFTTC
jgi:hypothetical protein